jgi:cellulose biosynthesis protein BcsQ
LAERLHRISFVSGKGGVGKTSLAVNFAWICSHFAKTLLVDLDFQNQGATGLLCSYLPGDCKGAVDHLLKPGRLEAADFVKLDPDLYFIPAVPLKNPPEAF